MFGRCGSGAGERSGERPALFDGEGRPERGVARLQVVVQGGGADEGGAIHRELLRGVAAAGGGEVQAGEGGGDQGEAQVLRFRPRAAELGGALRAVGGGDGGGVPGLGTDLPEADVGDGRRPGRRGEVVRRV